MAPNGNGVSKNFIIGVAGVLIMLLLGIVGFGIKSAWEDMRAVHLQIQKDLSEMKKCK